MKSFINNLLKKYGVKSSDVAIVDDNASPELSATLFFLNRPVAASSDFKRSLGSDTKNNSTSDRPCRWSNITEDMKDLSIAKTILSDLRTHSSSMPMPSPSFPGDNRALPTIRSNADWDNEALSNGVTCRSINVGVESQSNKQQKKFRGGYSSSCCDDIDSDHGDSLSASEEEEEIESDNDSASEDSIDILEDILKELVVRKYLDSNSSIGKFSVPSSTSTLKQKGLGSSTDLTDTTYKMDSSYQSILDYNKLVSNHQAPRLPQRKISQEKLRTLTSFLSSDSIIEGRSDHNNSLKNNALFDTISEAPDHKQQQPRNGFPLDVLSFVTSASQILDSDTSEIKKKKIKKKAGSGSFIGGGTVLDNKNQVVRRGIGSNDHDRMRLARAQRLRDALGPMAATFGTQNDDMISPNRSRFISLEEKGKCECCKGEGTTAIPPLPPSRASKRKGEKEIRSGSVVIDRKRMTAVSSSSSSSNSSSNSLSSPNCFIDDSSSSTISVHSAETLKSSNLPWNKLLPVIVDSTD